ncbi:serine protease FAM111A-like [Engraulis encrasicolus]|uniref:serine protease FAM111A-like n=1 Tax=Engraulis encrasicolus TaxID=184585 RepID=UPI002FCFDB29
MDLSQEKQIKSEDTRPCSEMESGQHSHTVSVELGELCQSTTCTKLQTVLDVIKSNVVLNAELPSKDEKIIIQLGNDRPDNGTIIATHFPCSCIEDGVTLVVTWVKDVVENPPQNKLDEKTPQNQGAKLDEKTPEPRYILPKDKYVLFYIDTEGGENAKSKELFQSKSVKKYKCLCVYGKKGMTVADVLERDCRFSNDIIADDYYLSIRISDRKPPKTHKTQLIDNLAGKTFLISVDRKKRQKSAQHKVNDSLDGEKSQRDANPHKSPTNSAQGKDRARLPAGIQQHGISLKTAIERGDIDTTEIYNRLCEQFPELIKWMESRFPADSYQKDLELKKENFGNIQQSFSEAHRIRMLLELGESVCYLSVGTVSQGTGFVLFDKLILTNAHLFDNLVIKDKNIVSNIQIWAHFNYEKPMSNEFYSFTAENKLVDFERSLDYAVLELKAEEHAEEDVPPGLLKHFGQLPDDGEVCVIGHPEEKVKTVDPTFILPKKQQQQSTDTNMCQAPLPMCSIKQYFEIQGLEIIKIKESGIDYKTRSMIHGSSGSPVFDGSGNVVGLHTSGVFLSKGEKQRVVASAHPLLTIFESFVWHLKKTENDTLLERVVQVAEKNANELLKDKLDCVLKCWPDVVRPMGLMGSEPADAQKPGISRVDAEQSDDEHMDIQ